jgi:hypothetical protein
MMWWKRNLGCMHRNGEVVACGDELDHRAWFEMFEIGLVLGTLRAVTGAMYKRVKTMRMGGDDVQLGFLDDLQICGSDVQVEVMVAWMNFMRRKQICSRGSGDYCR